MKNISNLHLALSGIWNSPDRYISRTEAKFSGFLSKKYSGGLPGMYSSHNSRISSMLSVLISLPSLVFGYLMKCLLQPWNLSPPTSRMTYCLRPCSPYPNHNHTHEIIRLTNKMTSCLHLDRVQHPPPPRDLLHTSRDSCCPSGCISTLFQLAARKSANWWQVHFTDKYLSGATRRISELLSESESCHHFPPKCCNNLLPITFHNCCCNTDVTSTNPLHIATQCQPELILKTIIVMTMLLNILGLFMFMTICSADTDNSPESPEQYQNNIFQLVDDSFISIEIVFFLCFQCSWFFRLQSLLWQTKHFCRGSSWTLDDPF